MVLFSSMLTNTLAFPFNPMSNAPSCLTVLALSTKQHHTKSQLFSFSLSHKKGILLNGMQA